MKLTVEHGQFGYTTDNLLFHNLNFTVNEGEILAVLGPNGVGKTTLLRCITLLLKWHDGQTVINGVPMIGLNRKKIWEQVSYVPQSSFSRFAYTVIDMVLLGRSSHLKIYSTPSKKDHEIAMQALEQVGIPHLHGKKCNEISGGEYQLVLIARALAAEPHLLILDEPESHLDLRNQILVLSMLEKVVRDGKLSCIINTHYPEHAVRLADNALLLGKNRKYLFGRTKDLITTENISEYFGVNVKIIPFDHRGKNFSAIIPLELSTRPH